MYKDDFRKSVIPKEDGQIRKDLNGTPELT